mgnify:CR=1 FL=1
MESLLEYIDTLEKEKYIYNNKNLNVNAIVDQLIYYAKLVRSEIDD